MRRECFNHNECKIVPPSGKKQCLRVEVEEDDDETLLLRALHATTRRKKRENGPTKLPCRVNDDLFLSDAFHVSNPNYLRQLGITHVLNLAAGETAQVDYESWGIHKLEIFANDSPFYDIMQHFSECVQFYHQARINNGKLVVHCKGGINRSSTIALALYMYLTKTPIVEAADHINAQRGPCLWNLSFRKQIVDWARKNKLMGRWYCEAGGKQDFVSNLPNPTSPSRRNTNIAHTSPQHNFNSSSVPSSPLSPNRSSIGYCGTQHSANSNVNSATPYLSPSPRHSAPFIYG